MKIKWLVGAERSLDEAYEFLENVSPVAAAKMYNIIMDDVLRLATMPFIGPIEPWLDDEPVMFRSLVSCKRYKIIYYVEDDSVYIADVWDCRQDPGTLKQRVTESAEV